MSRETILRQYLDTVRRQYTHILLDCQPSLGMLTVNTLAAANRVLIPVQAEYLPAKGLEQLLQTIGKVRRQINHKLEIDGILLTIILKEDWSKVQILLQQRQRKSPASNSPCHRYAGLLVCGDCSDPFVGIKRDWNGKRRVEYICKSYMRHGKTVCPSHRIHEEVLDQAVWNKLNLRHDTAAQELGKIKDLQKCLALRKPVLDARRLLLQEAIQKLEQEIDEIVIAKISSAHCHTKR